MGYEYKIGDYIELTGDEPSGFIKNNPHVIGERGYISYIYGKETIVKYKIFLIDFDNNKKIKIKHKIVNKINHVPFFIKYFKLVDGDIGNIEEWEE